MTTTEFILNSKPGDSEEWITFTEVENLLKNYSKQKCQELLLLVAEKAEITGCNKSGGFYIDKNSILNVVDLDSFIEGTSSS